MKKNNRGFFLSETMVVIAIVAIVLLGVFKIFTSTYTNYKEKEKYNTVNAISAVSTLQKYYSTIDSNYFDMIADGAYIELTNIEQYESDYYNDLKQILDVNSIYLINMKKIYQDSNINSLNLSVRKYINTLKNYPSEYIIVASIGNNEFGSVSISNSNNVTLVGDPDDEYSVIIPLHGSFVDPGYTNWNGDEPLTEWEDPLDTSTEGTYYLHYDFNGYLLRRKVIVINSALYNVQYIKDCVNGSTADTGNYWVEIKAMKNGVNVASTATVNGPTASALLGNGSAGNWNKIIDGDTTDSNYVKGTTSTGYQCVVVNLGSIQNLDEIDVWHYIGSGRTYYSNTTYVSSDNETWLPVIASDEAETSAGKKATSSIEIGAVTPIYRVTNLIPNSSFENTGWSGCSYNTTYKKYGSYSCKLTGTTSTAEVIVTSSSNIALDKTHIYYSRVEGYQTDKFGNYVQIYWPVAEPFFGRQILSSDDVWNGYSNKIERASFTNGNYPIRFDYDNEKVAGVMYFDGAMLIDLTVTFGSGNEHSKEWCDANINYFENTQNLHLNF